MNISVMATSSDVAIVRIRRSSARRASGLWTTTAGESLTPSPIIATTLPLCPISRFVRALSAGNMSAMWLVRPSRWRAAQARHQAAERPFGRRRRLPGARCGRRARAEPDRRTERPRGDRTVARSEREPARRRRDPLGEGGDHRLELQVLDHRRGLARFDPLGHALLDFGPRIAL